MPQLRMLPYSLNGNAVAKDEFGYALKPGHGFNREGVDTIQFRCRGRLNRICSVALTLGEPTHPRWHWDGNMDAPTLTPSIGCDQRCGWHGSITNGVIEP